MKATERILKGEEVLNSYGELPRADLLRRYGYITSKYEPYDVVELPQSLLVDAIQEYRKLEDHDLRKRVSLPFS